MALTEQNIRELNEMDPSRGLKEVEKRIKDWKGYLHKCNVDLILLTRSLNSARKRIRSPEDRAQFISLKTQTNEHCTQLQTHISELTAQLQNLQEARSILLQRIKGT